MRPASPLSHVRRSRMFRRGPPTISPRFLAHTADDRDSALWTLFATCGLRRAEALRLGWDDLDLDAGQLSVRRTLAYVGTQPVLGEPKTPRSRRLVVLPAETVAALRDHRRRQLEERLAAGGDYDDQRLVFCDPHGQPLSPSTVSRRFERLGREAGLPRLTLHGLRHTFATLALRAGVPSKVVAEVLGHASHAHDRRYLHSCHARDAGRRHRARRRTLAPLGGANRAALSVVNEGAELRDPVP